MPQTDLEGAMHIAEQLRQRIEGMAIAHSGSAASPFVTISAGIASRRCEPGRPMRDWIGNADKLLYKSKSAGRNRITGRSFDAD